MFVNSYQEFCIQDKVRVRNDIVNDFLISNSYGENYLSIFNYIIKNQNLLTIKQIDFVQTSIFPANFYFLECDGSLLYGQFVKNHPIMFVLNSKDF